MNEYMNDEELLQFIADIEKNDIVKAPPMIAEMVFEKIDNKDRIIEYKKFRNRVIAAVACILVITVVVPEWIKFSPEVTASYFPQNEKKVDLVDSKIFGGLGDTHYISEFMNGREE